MDAPTGKSGTQEDSEPIVRVYLVRHGETQENRDGIIQGQKDTVLNETGQEQARMVGERFRVMKIDRLYSSDLKRALGTAEAILAHHPEVRLEEQKEMRERAMGDLEGTTVQPDTKLVMASDATVESNASFNARIVGWWNERILGHVLSKAKDSQPMTVVVTTHGGVIRTLVRELIGSRKAECDKGVVVWTCLNTSVSVIEVGQNRKGRIVAFGDVSHLDLAKVALRSVQ